MEKHVENDVPSSGKRKNPSFEDSSQDLWTLEEDEKLCKAVDLYTDPTKIKRKRIDWDNVSKYLNGARTPKQCYSRWTTTAMHNLDGRKVGPWEPEDDAILIAEVERQKRENNMKVSWQAVSDNVKLRRNRKQCMARYNNVLQYQMSDTKKVGVWNAAEDSKLIEAVEMFRGKGRKNGISWGDVVKQLNYTRSQKQCKKRWDDAFADVYKHRASSPASLSSESVQSNKSNFKKAKTSTNKRSAKFGIEPNSVQFVTEKRDIPFKRVEIPEVSLDAKPLDSSQVTMTHASLSEHEDATIAAGSLLKLSRHYESKPGSDR